MLVVGGGADARLDFVQALDFKVVELFSARLVASPDAVVRAHITHRFNALRARNGQLQARLNGVVAGAGKPAAPALANVFPKTPGSRGY